MSAHCYDLAVAAAVLAAFLLLALCALCIHIRNALLGARLMKACAGDYQTAVLAITNVAHENALLIGAIREDLQ